MTQPEALRLADVLDRYYEDRGPSDEKKAAAELRRLHELNQELVEALQAMAIEFDSGDVNDGEWAAIQKARSAIAQATGENK